MAASHKALHALSLAAARQIASECSSQETDASSASLRGCGRPLVQLLGRQAVKIVQMAEGTADWQDEEAALVARRLEDLLELAHSRFYAFSPSDLPPCWRQLYTDACILQFAQRWLAVPDDADLDTGCLDGLVRPLDMALILAGGEGPLCRGRRWIFAALDLLQSAWEAADASGPHDWSTAPVFSLASEKPDPPVRRPVLRHAALGAMGFQAYLDAGRKQPGGPQPVFLTGMTDHWPARQRNAPSGRPWAAPDYLRWRTLGGRRLVPVELGRSYVDAGWTQAVVPFAQVLDGLVGTSQKMYLAQHDLFSQMPHLREDICVHDACYTVTGDEEPDEIEDPLLNAWLGPPGTITPLHTDAHHNLLTQVVGRKYLRLYSPAQTAALRPRGREGGIDMGNTSSIDVGAVEGWDEAPPAAEDDDYDEEAFRNAPYVDCILEPGDVLYIPRDWWHYVRGLSVSFSISFWWD